jgi:aminoglycoside 6'-N-acetyltransferase I
VTAGITIRTVRKEDAAAWEPMRQALWPSAAGEHAGEIAAYFAGDRRDPAEALMAFDQDGTPLGFAELTLRSHAEGCRSDRIAYLEGWWVEPGARRRGVGAALMRAAEDWGRAQGCTEMASDTNLDNTVSAQVHKTLGFSETDRIICFRKSLEPAP